MTTVWAALKRRYVQKWQSEVIPAFCTSREFSVLQSMNDDDNRHKDSSSIIWKYSIPICDKKNNRRFIDVTFPCTGFNNGSVDMI